MPVSLESTTDSKEAVTAALGDLAQKESKVENKSVPAQKASETTEESDTADNAIEASDDESQADDSDTDDDSDVAKDDDKPKKRKSGYQRRFDKLTRQKSELEREKEYWREQALKSQKPNQDESAPKKAESSDEPKEDEFETHKDYVKALARWEYKQELTKAKLEEKQAAVKTEHEQQVDTYAKRAELFKKEHKDFEETLSDVDDVEMSVTVRQVILESENGPELAYKLAKNPEEYARICALSPIAAARELGRFEASLKKSSDQNQTEKPETKKAKPQPLKTVGSNQTGSGKKSIYDADLSQEEFEELRAAQLARRRA